MLNTIYVILNIHLNYNLDIRPNGHFFLKIVSPFYEGEGVGSIPTFFFFFFSWAEGITSSFFFFVCVCVCVLNFHKIRVRHKMTLSFLSLWTNLLYEGLLRSQILFM
jgi:hypothetical protein